MAVFWFIAGVLTTLAALVLMLPWLRTIPRLERLPAVPWQLPLLIAILGAVSVTLYRWWGHPEIAGMTAARGIDAAFPDGRERHPGVGGAAVSMADAAATLESKLAKGGSDADWELLAKSYEFLDRSADAAAARSHRLPARDAQSPAADAGSRAAAAAPLTPDTLSRLADADKYRRGNRLSEAASIYKDLATHGQMSAEAWANYADTAASLEGGKLKGLPESLVDRALALDPDQPKALWLKASAYEEAGRYADALPIWQRLKLTLPSDSEDGKIIADNIQHAAESERTQPVAAQGAAEAAAISGEVSLATELAGKAKPGATLFIVAKSVDSPGPPVAVYRSSVGAWPVKFILNDSQSMLPGRNLSNAGRITVEARISLSGGAIPEAGDLRGKSGVIEPTERRPLKILISEVVG